MSTTYPIGYIELQASWTGPFTAERSSEVFGELLQKAAREHPGMVIHGSRMESTLDGARQTHFTYYLGLAPKVENSPPLNPRNLNDAPKKVVGSLPDDVPGVSIGWKEQQFGRGT